MEAIVICTVNARCLPVMAASIAAYAPHVPVYLSIPDKFAISWEGIAHWNFLPNTATNFGDAYNAALTEAFKRHQSVIVANDDVVLHPDTWRLLSEDLATLREAGHKVGFLGCRADYILWQQNIRSTIPNDRRAGLKWESEDCIIETDVIAPVFAYLSREAFQTAQFPPLNWYSDNVMCYDLSYHGYRHFISRSYVHHAGSQTVGLDHDRNHREAAPWVRQHRPELAAALFAS